MTDVNVMLYISLMFLADIICHGHDGYNAFVTDVIVTCIAVADGNHMCDS